MKANIFKGLVLLTIITLSVSVVFAEVKGVKKKRALAHEYGNVVMNNLSDKNNIAPVVFNHWLHRALYTCRLCHVDLAFAMQANGTAVKEDDNRKGFYCGACHNEKEAFGWIGRTQDGAEVKKCDRCHSYGKKVVFEKEFYKFTANFPRERFGNGIDWEKAENEGKLKLKDYIEGISMKRKPLAIPQDTQVKSQISDMPDIIFSHKKHAVWSGCELCHPDIFGVKKGGTVYNMEEIFNGKYCGVCHDKVAFPNIDCQRCHTKAV